MRVTAETKTRTRQALLRSARKLFEKRGFEPATTRDITAAAGIALGTLFNYFPSKEALALAIIAECLEAAEGEFSEKLRGDEPLEEALFLHIATGLRHLRPCRPYVFSVLESTLGPLTSDRACPEAQELRTRHLDTVRQLIARRQSRFEPGPARRPGPEPTEPSMVVLHLYWTLYLGVLSFWSSDESTHREDTLALLDQSTRLFVASLSSIHSGPEKSYGFGTQ